jgi:hypothetical protein
VKIDPLLSLERIEEKTRGKRKDKMKNARKVKNWKNLELNRKRKRKGKF